MRRALLLVQFENTGFKSGDRNGLEEDWQVYEKHMGHSASRKSPLFCVANIHVL